MTTPTSADPVPFFDAVAETALHRSEISDAIDQVLTSGQFVLGSEVTAFEAEVARDSGVSYAVGVNSGTDALLIGLRAAGIGAGDDVITTAFSFFATVEAIERVGAHAVMVDIDPHTFNLDAERIEAALSSRTRAIVAVHLFGHPADMSAIRAVASRHELLVIEDAAQAYGAAIDGEKVGSMGCFGAHSFYPTKNLGGLGDGGMIVTNDDAIADHARALGNHGSFPGSAHQMLGYNSRLDSLQAAALRVKLRSIDAANARRKAAAAHYTELLQDMPSLTLPIVRPHVTHVWNQFTVRVEGEHRDALAEYLKRHGIGCRVYYPTAMTRLPYVASREGSQRQLPTPEAERASAQLLSLPFGSTLTRAQQQRVAEVLSDGMAA